MAVMRGLPTGSKTRLLDPSGGFGNMLTTVSWYDDDRRPIQAFTENHLGGHDRIDTWYNERSAVDKTVQHHQYDASSDPHIFTTRFVYDVYSGALVRTYCQLDDDPEILVSRREFDPDGKLRRLRLHRPPGMDDFMQNIDYRYNDQGQLTHINNTALIVDAFNPDDNDVFGQELTYFDDSPEYDSSDPSVKNPVKRYDGNVSSMMWNAKTPDQDGTMLSRHAYLYKYDGFGQMTEADYLSDTPSTPGTFEDDPVIPEQFDERVNYDLGGNITRLNRSQIGQAQGGGYGERMDELTYRYEKGYQLKSVVDAGVGTSNGQYRHFTDGSQSTTDYTYDAAGKLLQDKNRHFTFIYNRLGLPRQANFSKGAHAYQIRYLYDASGNKLQKQVEIPACPPNTQCPPPGTTTTDYVGNFVYHNGELQMVYHPEGIIRPTPPSAENETEYVYDYFIKDYLGNVRVVLTEENATYDSSMVATMEEYRANWEEANFENIEEGREPIPINYPVDASFPFNQFIAKLVADNEMTIGPAKVLEVNQGDKVKLATQYFYEEDAPGTTYENLGFLVEEILVSMAAAGAGILPVGEGTLVNLANGSTNLGNHIANFLSNTMDTTGMNRPQAYLVWLAYDKDFKLDPTSSGALRVEDPNELGTLMSGEFPVNKPGYLHVYVANGTASKIINFDNLYVTTMQGQTRQINHYYPFGLRMRLGHGQKYKNMYTGKELQTGEYWHAATSTGLEMYDFHARFYDPQLGRWFTPDPAEQFANPYLAMGNNPVVYVDPDGEFIWAPIIIGAMIGSFTGAVGAGMSGASAGNIMASFGIGALAGAIGGAVGGSFSGGLGFGSGALQGGTSGFSAGFVNGAGNAYLNGANFGEGLMEGLKGGGIGAATGAMIGGVASGIYAAKHSGDFWSGKGATFESLGVPGESITIGDDVVYSSEYAKQFAHDYLPRVEGLNNLYADGSVPPGSGYENVGGRVYNIKGDEVRGITRYLGNKLSDVYMFQAAFTSKSRLYLSLGHELLHVAYNSGGIGFTDFMKNAKHASIHKWQAQQSIIWKFDQNHYIGKYNIFKQFERPYLDYKNYGFFLLGQKPW